MKIPNPLAAPTAHRNDPEATWRALTEALIFAAPYGTREYLSILDATGRPYDRDAATRRCMALGRAILADYPAAYKLLSCRAANDDAASRHRYSRYLPRRPNISTPSTRRMGPSLEARQEAADKIVSEW